MGVDLVCNVTSDMYGLSNVDGFFAPARSTAATCVACAKALSYCAPLQGKMGFVGRGKNGLLPVSVLAIDCWVNPGVGSAKLV